VTAVDTERVVSATPDAEAVRSARAWTIATTSGLAVSGHLPAWAEHDPRRSEVSLEELAVLLPEVDHCVSFDGVPLEVSGRGFDGDTEQVRFFRGSIDCHPFMEAPGPRVPLANIEILRGCWLHRLTPAGLASLSLTLRALADRPATEMHPALIATRHDWAQCLGRQGDGAS
jgi:hypothetical protein